MRSILIIRNNYLILSSEDEDFLDAVYDTLSFKDSSKAFTYGGRFDANRIVTVRFAKFVKDLDLPSLKIPIGFVDFVQSVLEDKEHSTIDERKPIPEVEIDQIENLEGIELMDHQVGAIYTALSYRRGIVMAPTGSGKTEIFLAILNMLESPSLVVFNRQQLTQQTVERARERGLDVGIVQGQNIEEKDITMATIQSIHKIENIKKYKNLILDEIHNVASRQYQEILKLSHWERVYGFSATPVNPRKIDLKSAKIIANVGSVIYNIGAKDLMEKGIIAKPKIYMVPINMPDDIDDFSYREAEKAGIIFNKYRNKMIASIAERHRGEGVLILNKYVDQGKEIQKLIPDAPFIWHEILVKDRLKIVQRFDDGEIEILIASRILDEGIDIKNFKVLIIASAGISFIKTIQRLGRGLRVTDEKKNITVYDFIDNTNFRLLKHSRYRIKTYKMFEYKDIIEFKEIDDAHI
jgi:DNA excision repair protein ERCC-3